MTRWLRRLQITICLLISTTAQAGSALEWGSWSTDMLSKAKSEGRFVILDLEAVWCHWCHVMEETTYRDAKVVELIKSKYIAVRADQDANPDLSARYGDWGWPATIIFAPDGTELVKRRGYIPPERMISLLQAVIDDPTPGPSVLGEDEIEPALSSQLSPKVLTKLNSDFDASYDAKNGGWGRVHKFIDPDSLDVVLQRAERGDASARKIADQTLKAATALIDPVWGGLYQYSDEADWLSPHYEKIMWYQANGLRQYAAAYNLFKDDTYLTAAKDIYRYLTAKLRSPDGAFYTSQDADVSSAVHGKDFYTLDDAARQKLGKEPRIDKNIYARENGWAIGALVAYANITGDSTALKAAATAADWIVQNRLQANGLFRHGENDRSGPYLGDTIAMGNAAIDLYGATGERRWLELASRTVTAMTGFRVADGGFAASKVAEGQAGVLAKPYRNTDEQMQAARFAIRSWRYLGDEKAKEIAEHAIKYLSASSFVSTGRAAAGTLLADSELSIEPTHITIVGHKDDASAVALHDAARRFPVMNLRLDWWDVREGPLLNADVTYPELDKAAAFACSNRLCSLPAFTPEELVTAVATMTRKPDRRAEPK